MRFFLDEGFSPRASVAALVETARERPARLLPALLSLVVLLGFAFATPLSRLGDASDYLLMTESLYWDHDLKWEPRDASRHFLLRDVRLDSPVGLQVTKGQDEIPRLTGYHSFYYPALAVPFYAVFRYRGFYVLNALLCWSFVLLLARHLSASNERGVAWTAALLAVGFSAAWSYVAWIHAEIFLMALCGLFAFLWRRRRIVAAGGVLGLLVGAQPVFAALALAFGVAELASRTRIRTLAVATALGILGAVPQYVYNLRAFGALHPLAALGTIGSRNITFDKLVRSLLDPAAGLIWFYPAVVLALCWVRWDRLFAAGVVGALAVLVATETSPSWYSHQVGLRYCAYIFPLFLFGIVRIPFRGFAPLAGAAWLALAGAGLATNPVGNSAVMSIANKSFLPFQVARRLPFYSVQHEVLWFEAARLSPDAGLLPGWSDGWTAGGEETFLLLRHAAGAQSVALDVEAWAVPGRPQHLTVASESGVVASLDLAPGSLRRIDVPLGPGDVRRGTLRFGDTIVLRLKADAWVPALLDKPVPDPRRLGVHVAGVRSRERTWLPPVPPH